MSKQKRQGPRVEKTPGAAFVRPDEPAEVASDPTNFNLRKWYTRGKARVVKYVEVYMAAGLEADIRELDAKIVATRGGIIDERLAGGTVSEDDRLVAMAREVEALRAEMAESRIVFKFRALDPGEFEAIKTSLGEKAEDDAALGYAMFAAQCIEPAGLSGGDFAELAEHLGEGYFGQTIIRTATAANAGESVSVPFSLNASEVLRTRGSSQN
ncbi:MAG: hypothetical protein HOQ27_10330 [Dermatophilaceae bacterium]|nr:hypothetical protein [Dermatophilaceae bacterium]